MITKAYVNILFVTGNDTETKDVLDAINYVNPSKGHIVQKRNRFGLEIELQRIPFDDAVNIHQFLMTRNPNYNES